MSEPNHSDNPAAQLEQFYSDVMQHSMADVPLINPQLEVRAVGFHRWQNNWLGVMVTPWFLNLMILPQQGHSWPARMIADGEAVVLEFPCGKLRFESRADDSLGPYLCCSLASPVNNFQCQQDIEDTARDILDKLQHLALKNLPSQDHDEPASPSRRRFLGRAVAG